MKELIFIIVLIPFCICQSYGCSSTLVLHSVSSFFGSADIDLFTPCSSYCWLVEPEGNYKVGSIVLKWDYLNSSDCETWEVFTSRSPQPPAFWRIKGNYSLPLEVETQGPIALVVLRSCCKSNDTGIWKIVYNSKEKITRTPTEWLSDMWQDQRNLFIIVIIAIVAFILLCAMLIVLWKICGGKCKESSDDEWLELERSREEIKKNREKEEYRTSSKKKLEECLNKSVSEDAKSIARASTASTPRLTRLDSIAVSDEPQASPSSRTSIDPPATQLETFEESDTDIPPTPSDLYLSSQSYLGHSMNDIKKSASRNTLASSATSLPDTPMETPIDTPLTTPGNTMRTKATLEALGEIDKMLEDLKDE